MMLFHVSTCSILLLLPTVLLPAWPPDGFQLILAALSQPPRQNGSIYKKFQQANALGVRRLGKWLPLEVREREGLVPRRGQELAFWGAGLVS